MATGSRAVHSISLVSGAVLSVKGLSHFNPSIVDTGCPLSIGGTAQGLDSPIRRTVPPHLTLLRHYWLLPRLTGGPTKEQLLRPVFVCVDAKGPAHRRLPPGLSAAGWHRTTVHPRTRGCGPSL